MVDDRQRVRVAPLLYACMEVLRDAEGPLPGTEVFDRVERRVTPTPYELESVAGREARWRNHMRWHTGVTVNIGWMTKRDGWSLTEAGEGALATYDTPEALFAEQQRLKRALEAQRERDVEALTDREKRIVAGLAQIGPGFWTTYDDLAEFAGATADQIGHFLVQHQLPESPRVLTRDGTVPPEPLIPARFRNADLRRRLAREGVEFDAAGRASPEQRVTAEQIETRLTELAADDAEAEAPARRAWLVRGSSVAGRDLVPVWLWEGSVSLAAARLAPVSPPVPRNELKRLVDAGYSGKSYAAREAKLEEFDAFCNTMRPDDLLLTTSQGQVYVGEVTGPATYTGSSDDRSNLRRRARWLNPGAPVPFARLPDPLPTRLHGALDVVELTEDMPAIERLLREAGVEAGAELADAALEPPAELEPFGEVAHELADDLLIDKSWLDELVDLLWERRQVILHGPPGTGKTYLARKLAAHLTRDVGAVKFVQFHPSYSYEDFFEGFRPVPAKDGRVSFDLRPGPLRRLVERARENPSDPYLLVIDEINRANLAKVFGELYFLLEYRDQQVELLYSPEEFMLPPNVFVIGTMNTADRSIALVDDAMRRRFGFASMHPDRAPVAELLDRWLAARPESDYPHNRDAPRVLEQLNRAIESPDLAIGPSYLMRESIYTRADGLDRVWRSSIMPLLAEHHYGAPDDVLAGFELNALRAGISGGRSGEAS